MNKILWHVKRVISNRYVLFAIRIVLGSIFILAAIGKIPEGAKFVDVVTGYGILPWELAKAYGLVLPWLELVLGVCLVIGILPRVAAGVSVLAILSFIIANGTAVYSYEAHVDYCGCFGVGFGETYYLLMKTSDALIIDIIMMVLAVIIAFYGGGRWKLDSAIRSGLMRMNFHQKDYE
jgi:uncharacterized membrane protein YphA (DoxX/SURF4 family)